MGVAQNRAAYAAMGNKGGGPVITAPRAATVVNVEATRRAGAIVSRAITQARPFVGQRAKGVPAPLPNVTITGYKPDVPGVTAMMMASGITTARGAQRVNAQLGREAQASQDRATYANITSAVTNAANEFSARYGAPLGTTRIARAVPAVKRAEPLVNRAAIGPRDRASIDPIARRPVLRALPATLDPGISDAAPLPAPVLMLGDEDADRALYASWVASVKANGGVAVAYPNAEPKSYYGWPAGRYSASIIAAKMAAKLWRQPDGWTRDKAYGYYVAPQQVKDAARSLGIAKDSEVRNMGFWDSFKFLNIGSTAGKVALGAGALLLASMFMRPSGRG